MRYLRGISNAFISYIGLILTVVIGTDGYLSINGKKYYFYTTALAAGDAATGITAGSIAFTTHATGRGQVFVADGTSWQDYNDVFVASVIATITTTGAVSAFLTAPVTGKLVAAGASFTDALAADNTNYITHTLSNLGNAGAAMLAAADTNTTKAAGGTGYSANVSRSGVVHGTAGNVAVTRGHRLQYTFTVTGTLANTLTNGQVWLVFARTI